MLSLNLLSILIPSALSLIPTALAATIDARAHYTKPHSLGNEYTFRPRDGWQAINVTDLTYKYSHHSVSASDPVKKRSNSNGILSLADLGGTVKHVIDDVWNGLKGIGSSEGVTITWYTGHDLLNPSCWATTSWAPTDNSMACAITLEGWVGRPKCFTFLELCNSPQKCVFVRVVDTCAGCAPGSKHVDLTEGAFTPLADLAEGVLTVQMRGASEPSEWFEDLWGPKEG